MPITVDELRGLEVSFAIDEAVAGDARAERLLGIGWRRPRPPDTEIDIRVAPRHRRRGVGGALLATLAGGAASVVVAADAGHPRVRRFLTRRGFEHDGAVFHQRWDGELSDIPPSFRTATVADERDAAAAMALLRRAGEGVWPPLNLRAEDFDPSRYFALAALRGDERIGVLVAHLTDDAYAVDGVGVLPAHRQRGIGRALLTAVMARAIDAGVGVTLQVDQRDDATLQWAHKLGLWTFRTWAYYRRRRLAHR